MVEVKADALEDSFERIEEEEDGVAALKIELEQLILRDPYTNKPYVHFYATQTLDLLVAAAVEEPPRA